MKKSVLWKVFAAFFGFIAIMYMAELLTHRGNEFSSRILDTNTARHKTIAVFGATGTAGDGLLKATMNDPDVQVIHVITRRQSPRIEAGVSSGLVKMTLHTDYLDYSAIHDVLAEVDTVYWAIGLSAFGLDEQTYRRIHVDFPLRLISEWIGVRDDRDMSFHYISGTGARADSKMMWAREKARAEVALFEMAKKSTLRVITYRPDYIAPTKEQANFGHNVLYTVLAPINSAVRATAIGQAMLEVSAGAPQFENGTILENQDIIGYSNVYEQRLD